MARAVLLQSLGNGVLWDVQGNALNGHAVYVYQRGTTTQVPVYSSSSLTILLTQPLLTGDQGASPGGIPGYAAAGQDIDFYDSSSGLRQPAALVAAGDLIGSDGMIGGPGSVGLPASVLTANSTPRQATGVQWVFNVKDGAYGAVGNGTTDDTAAIKAAIAAASAVGGGVVFFPAGTYLVSQDGTNAWCVNVPTGVRLCGSGKGTGNQVGGSDPGATIITSAYNGVVVNVGTGVYDWGVESLVVQGTGLGASQVTAYVNGNQGHMTDVGLMHAGQYDLQLSAAGLSGCLENTFTNVYCAAAGSRGCVAFGFSFCVFVDCEFRTSVADGFYNNTAQSHTFINCDFEANNQAGGANNYAGFTNQAGEATLIGCHFEGNTTATIGIPLQINAGNVTEIGTFYSESRPNINNGGAYTSIGVTENMAPFLSTGSQLPQLIMNPAKAGGGAFTVTDNSGGALTIINGLAGVVQAGGLRVKEVANGKQGTATLAAGTVTVANTSVTANSRILLTVNTPGGTVGSPYVSARTAGTSFVITSTSATDTSTIAYQIFEPG